MKIIQTCKWQIFLTLVWNGTNIFHQISVTRGSEALADPIKISTYIQAVLRSNKIKNYSKIYELNKLGKYRKQVNLFKGYRKDLTRVTKNKTMCW
jgi:hypothetical protein